MFARPPVKPIRRCRTVFIFCIDEVLKGWTAGLSCGQGVTGWFWGPQPFRGAFLFLRNPELSSPD